MKMTKFYAPLAALLLTGAAFTSCSSDDDKSEVAPANKNWSLSIEAATPSLDTRALTYLGTNSKIIATWAEGETMEVYNVSTGSDFRGLLTPSEYGGEKSKLVTTPAGLTGNFKIDDALKIYFPKRDVTYLNQDGQLETISKKYDYSSVTVYIKAIDEVNRALTATANNSPEFAALFKNKQAIVKFVFTTKDDAGADVAVQAKKVTVSGIDNNEQKCIVTYEETTSSTSVAYFGDIEINIPDGKESNEVWAALSCNKNVNLSLYVEGTDGKNYTARTQTSVFFENGMYYEIPVPLVAAQ